MTCHSASHVTGWLLTPMQAVHPKATADMKPSALRACHQEGRFFQVTNDSFNVSLPLLMFTTGQSPVD